MHMHTPHASLACTRTCPMPLSHAHAHAPYLSQAMQPGLDAWGATFCCGTNFAVRAAALAAVGWFPTESITEDFLLGLKLTAQGWRCRYHSAVVSTGEAPEDLRQIFKQRNRWCCGCFQVHACACACPWACACQIFQQRNRWWRGCFQGRVQRQARKIGRAHV